MSAESREWSDGGVSAFGRPFGDGFHGVWNSRGEVARMSSVMVMNERRSRIVSRRIEATA